MRTEFVPELQTISMKKHVWLEFENDDKMNTFLRVVMGDPFNHYSTTGYSRVGSGFTKRQIEIAKKQFGAKVVEKSK